MVDRLAVGHGAMPRPAWARRSGTAFGEGEGVALVLHDGGRLRFTVFPTCSACDTPSVPLTPNLFSFNNPRGACEACNGFGAVLEYAESLIVPDPSLAHLRRRDRPVDQAALRGAAPGARQARARTRRRRERAMEEAQGDGAAGAAARQEQAATSGSFPSSRASRRSATSSTSGCSCGSTSWRRPVPSCGGTRLNEHARCGAAGGPDDLRHRRRCRSTGCMPGSPPCRSRRTSARSANRCWTSWRRGSSTCATWGSATSRSTGRPARSRAARRSASRCPTRSARGWWTRCTCSTSPPSGCTRVTPTGCSRCCTGCATAATPWWWWSTTSPRSGRPTSCSSWDPARASTAGGWCTRARSRGRCSRSPASTSPARSASACPACGGWRVRAGSGCAAPRCTTCRAWTATSRSARSRR